MTDKETEIHYKVMSDSGLNTSSRSRFFESGKRRKLNGGGPWNRAGGKSVEKAGLVHEGRGGCTWLNRAHFHSARKIEKNTKTKGGENI